MKLGNAFSDNLIASSLRSRHQGEEEKAWWHGAGRTLLFTTGVCGAFFLLFIRLVHLTAIRGHELRNLADGNRTRELIRHAPRGILYDRTGKPLTVNVPKDRFDYTRQYPYGSALAHILGYTGEVSQKELSDEYYQLRQYRPGDAIGRSGAEAVFEDKLHGRNGKELVEVDAEGNSVRILGNDPEVAGEPVALSVDATLSQAVADAFPKDLKGAVVVAKPSTGEILALYSAPSFDPGAIDESLLTNPDAPLFDRAIGGAYPPGSTFKIVTALGALQEEAITKDTIIEDNGTITIGSFSFSNWYFTQYGKTEGPVDIVKAIQRSNDIFFYRTGERLGITKLADWARRVGIGKPLGIELSGEAGGLMPDPAWKNSYFTSPADMDQRNNQWYLGDTYHIAIGQGYLLTTPLQVNTWTNVIANGGKECKPTIEKMQNSNFKLQNCKDLGIKKETIQLITEGMQKACEPGGTGWPLFEFKIQNSKFKIEEKEASSSSSYNPQPTTYNHISVACKTGTAEYGDPKNKTHAWFTAFAPVASKGETLRGWGEPEISITVLVEGGGEGSNVAAPIAKKILEHWFSR